jgi:tmRNA-binding protein
MHVVRVREEENNVRKKGYTILPTVFYFKKNRNRKVKGSN